MTIRGRTTLEATVWCGGPQDCAEFFRCGYGRAQTMRRARAKGWKRLWNPHPTTRTWFCPECARKVLEASLVGEAEALLAQGQGRETVREPEQPLDVCADPPFGCGS